jgi:ADP-ribose pyrophosphatase YjhB (NUDIX family)
MTRIDYYNDYYNDPNAPRANTIVPATSAIVTDQRGRILLHRRSDNQFWSIPGGTMEIGETIRDTVIREVKEETGLDVEPQRLVGIYSNPNHVIAYPNGEVRQQFSICFACRLLGGRLTTGDESLGVGFFAPAQIEQIPVHPSVRLRIKHYLESCLESCDYPAIA